MSEIPGNNRPLLVYLIISNFLLNFGFQFWQTLFNNFAVEALHIGPIGVGWVQALREVPGLMGFLLGFLALLLSEIRIMNLSLILLGIGTLLSGQAHDIWFLGASTVIMSIGFHFFYTANSSVILMSVQKQHAPRMLGHLGSLAALAALAATGTVYLLAGRWDYRMLFLVIGGLVAMGGVLLLPIGGAKEGLPLRRRVILRRRYWLYYTLSFLMGSRRHIFTTFAIFLLVREYGINIQTTAILFLVNNLVNVYASQLAGRLVGQWGERLMLSITFATLALVFLGYAYVTSLWVLFALFVVDNVMFGFNLALTTYFQKIAVTQEEITSNVSVEQTINHIAAIIIPVVGGSVWELFGMQAPFLVGVGIVLVALILVQAMRISPEPASAAAGG